MQLGERWVLEALQGFGAQVIEHASVVISSNRAVLCGLLVQSLVLYRKFDYNRNVLHSNFNWKA